MSGDQKIRNRSGLERINYRIGTYSSFREQMINALNTDSCLVNWTYRGSDDPAIAILEGAAQLGEIVSFYQDIYANEAWIGTASQPESLREIARLTGYRQSPALAGSGWIAAEIKGTETLVVSARSGFQLPLNNSDSPVECETSTETTLLPELNSFQLLGDESEDYLRDGDSLVYLPADEFQRSPLKPGDRIGIAGSPTNSNDWHVTTVKELVAAQEYMAVRLSAPWKGGRLLNPTIFKLGRTFREFGYQVSFNTTPAPSFYKDDRSQLILDRAVEDLSAGSRFFIRYTTPLKGRTPYIVFDTVTIERAYTSTHTVGAFTGACTCLQLAQDTIIHQQVRRRQSTDGGFDLRSLEYHEILAQFIGHCRRPYGEHDQALNKLRFWGTARSYAAFKGRTLQMIEENESKKLALIATVTTDIFSDDLARNPTQMEWRWLSISSDHPLYVQDFPRLGSRRKVFGNLLQITQGKTLPEFSLGNGDARQSFQTFALPQSPLTRLPAGDGSDKSQPQIEVRVNGLLWNVVDSLLDCSADAPAYVIREDAEGNTFLQFGDGCTGARLPSGLANVRCTYRVGAGANGPLRESTSPTSLRTQPRLDKLYFLGELSGGQPREDAARIRTAAPKKLLTFDRLVTLRDIEAIAAELVPGSAGVSAHYELLNGTLPIIEVRIVPPPGGNIDAARVERALNDQNLLYGEGQIPLVVTPIEYAPVVFDVVYGLSPGYRESDVSAELRRTLSDTGKLRPSPARVGTPLRLNYLLGLAQNVPGVAYAEARTLRRVDAPNDPALPFGPDPALDCISSTEILWILPERLTLSALQTTEARPQ